MGATHVVDYKTNKEVIKIDATFVCSGCGERLPILELSMSGPNFLKPIPTCTHWCYKPSCRVKAMFLSVAINRELDITARKLIQDARNRGDKEDEEAIMLLYMCNKWERVE